MPSPVSRFLAQLDDLRSGSVLDMDAVGRLLAELAADEDYFAPLIAEIGSVSNLVMITLPGQARSTSLRRSPKLARP